MVESKRILAVLCAVAGVAGVGGATARAADSPPLPIPLPTVTPPVTTSSSSSAPTAGSSHEAGRTTSVAVAAAEANALATEINRIRRLHKLGPLRLSAQLARAGTEHAKALALAGQFTHAWPDGSPFSAWMRRYYPANRYRRWSVGENLVWQSPGLSARAAVRMWLASPPHRRNLLRPGWRELGLGVVHATAAPGAYGGSDVDVAAAEFGARSR